MAYAPRITGEHRMKNHAKGTFAIEGWDETTFDEGGGVKMSRARVTKRFQGDLEGTSVAEITLALAREESRAYAGFERIDGRLNGRSGTFVLHHNAGAESVSWTVLPHSGTGDLAKIRGTFHIVIEPGGGHAYTFDYEVD
jgi:hypothetical protein